MESAAKDEPLEGAAWEGAMILKTQRHQSRADGSDTSWLYLKIFLEKQFAPEEPLLSQV